MPLLKRTLRVPNVEVVDQVLHDLAVEVGLDPLVSQLLSPVVGDFCLLLKACPQVPHLVLLACEIHLELLLVDLELAGKSLLLGHGLKVRLMVEGLLFE